MPATQEHRPVAVYTPLGDDVLLFHHMTAKEQLGRLFEYEVEMLSDDLQIRPEDVLGATMTVRLDPLQGETRYYHGHVSRFSHVGTSQNRALYRATLRPWLWFLTRTADCRIFQEMTVPDIIMQVFRDQGFTDFEDLLTGSYRPWEYCVQYRETDFNFVSRLMEQEGIYYYFKHENGKHTMVLADSYSSHEPVPGYDEVPYFPPYDTEQRERDNIFEWTGYKEVQPGQFCLNDFNFKVPKTNLLSRNAFPREHAAADYEIYDYPGEYEVYGDGEGYARVRLEELQSQHEQLHGRGNARGLTVGALFKLADHPREDQNREYLITGATYQLASDEYESVMADSGDTGAQRTYQCEITAIDAQQPFRPARVTPKPYVRGPQTAWVVGPAGEEIWTDQHGRVKLQFHWDRYGKSDENSSCWIRVSQHWADKRWGGIHIPRIGQEVIVEFLEGDPDRPIITGRVYNGENMPPYALPANKTQSGVKSRSSMKGTPENFNELRFEDLKDSEEVYFHAEKDFNRVVENNDTLKVGFEKQQAGDQTTDVYNDRTTTIGNNDTLKVGFDIQGAGDQTIDVYNNRTTTIDQGNDALQIKTGNRTVQIDQGNDSLQIKMGNRTINIDMGQSTTEAMQAIVLRVGANSIRIDQTGITFQGIQVNVQGQARLALQAPITQVNAAGLLQMQGGVVKIN